MRITPSLTLHQADTCNDFSLNSDPNENETLLKEEEPGQLQGRKVLIQEETSVKRDVGFLKNVMSQLPKRVKTEPIPEQTKSLGESDVSGFEPIDFLQTGPSDVFEIINSVAVESLHSVDPELIYARLVNSDCLRDYSDFNQLVVDLVIKSPGHIAQFIEKYPSRIQQIFNALSANRYDEVYPHIKELITVLLKHADKTNPTAKRNLHQLAACLIKFFDLPTEDLPFEVAAASAVTIFSELMNDPFKYKTQALYEKGVSFINDYKIPLDQLGLTQLQCLEILHSSEVVKQNLKYLDFGMFQISDKDFLDSVQGLQSLEHIGVGSRSFRGTSLESLRGMKLASIRFSDCLIDQPSCFSCFDGMELEVIELSNCFDKDVFQTRVFDLAAVFGRMPVRTLKLNTLEGAIDEKSLIDLLHLISKTLTSLELCRLGFRINSLIDHLPVNLKSLNINCMKNTLRPKLSIIRNLAQLEELTYFFGGVLHSTDLTCLTQSLRKLKCSHFDEISEKGAGLIFGLNQLKSLSFAHSKGVNDALVEALPQKMEHLELRGCLNVSAKMRVRLRERYKQGHFQKLDLLRIRDYEPEDPDCRL